MRSGAGVYTPITKSRCSDEPLSNIDQVTKLEVATFLKDLFASLQIPIIFVTHQYEDAQFLHATIAILIDGIIEQIGSYQELINDPKKPLVKQLLSPFSIGTNI